MNHHCKQVLVALTLAAMAAGKALASQSGSTPLETSRQPGNQQKNIPIVAIDPQIAGLQIEVKDLKARNATLEKRLADLEGKFNGHWHPLQVGWVSIAGQKDVVFAFTDTVGMKRAEATGAPRNAPAP
ncbi:MAG: hypothetical protein HXX11_00870 [Desulfuromonadales bacterium]|nr:hypothetical protein [Desulfuromonadales bacterium]